MFSNQGQSSYTQKHLTVSFQLGQGSFDNSGNNTLELVGFRCLVHVELPTGIHPPTATVQIFGMSLSHINELSKAGLVYKLNDNSANTITVKAGDDQNTVTIYSGIIIEAFPAFYNPPDAGFIVLAAGGRDLRINPTDPVTFNGGTSIETALKAIIKPAGLTLENSGVNATLNNPYFPGTVAAQIESACNAADCFYYIDSIAKVLSIWPKNSSRSTSQIQTISPETGMIGYPAFQNVNIKLRTIFVPGSFTPQNFGPGHKIMIKSQLAAANGMATIIWDSLNLSSELPDGPWERNLIAVKEGT